MTRKEAEALGLPTQPSKHSMTKRAPWHDYSQRGLYLITLVIKDRLPLLGTLIADPEPRISLSPLGTTLIEHEIGAITKAYPMVKVWQVCVMPDHIHMIVRVNDDMPPKKHLGTVIKGFKSGCNNAYWDICGNRGNGLFEKGYNDRLLFEGNQLTRWKKYLEDNPRRLFLKRRHPDLFTVLHNLNIHGRECQIVGNRFLLDIPDKMAVIVHHNDSMDDFADKYALWMACGERGGVLVSAAVAPKEKEVMHDAMERGHYVIWLRNNGFKPLYKPYGRSFDACSKGQLLEVSPFDYTPDKNSITRKECEALNALAEDMARESAL